MSSATSTEVSASEAPVTEEVLQVRASLMMAYLDKLQVQRDAEKRARKERQEAKIDPKENIKAFLAKFAESKKEILYDLVGSKQQPKDRLAGFFDEYLAAKLDALQESAAHASFFLPGWEQRQCKLAIDSLTERVADMRAELIPRKKFRFKTRRRKKALQELKEKVAKGEQITPSKANGDEVDVDLKEVEDAFSQFQTKDPDTGYEHRVGETLYKGPGSVAGKDVWFSHLSNCTVTIMDTPTAVRIDNVQNCTFLIGPTAGSAHIEYCKNCTFVLATRQIRIHSANHCKFYLHVKSNPIIEHSTNTAFAPYTLSYPLLEQHFQDADLVLDPAAGQENKWNKVNDFNWLRAKQSPNWRELQPRPDDADADATNDEENDYIRSFEPVIPDDP